VGRAILTLEKLRELNPHMPSSTALIFLYVASKPGVQVRELEDLTGMTNSATSRHVLVLTERGDVARNQPGLGLVDQFPDMDDLRIKRLRLTPKGEALADAIEKINSLK
jgi:DNA-binding MarR family transcriptional regulator